MIRGTLYMCKVVFKLYFCSILIYNVYINRKMYNADNVLSNSLCEMLTQLIDIFSDASFF